MIFTPGAIVGIVLFVGLAFGLLKIDHTIYGPDRDTYEKHMKKQFKMGRANYTMLFPVSREQNNLSNGGDTHDY